MKVTSLDKVEKLVVDMEGAKNVSKQIPVGQSDGSPNFSFRVFTIRPDGHTPYHEHTFEHINYVIEGNGVVVTGTGEERTITKGDFALVLPNEKHQYKNTSQDEPLIVICAVPKDYE
ncbi:MAG: cupin domain-containing protein [Chloroflexota bacterium]|nr:cupin domain-containing protein [Chloroflexota bacterium]